MGKKQQRKDKAETSVTGYLEKMRADGVEGMEGMSYYSVSKVNEHRNSFQLLTPG